MDVMFKTFNDSPSLSKSPFYVLAAKRKMLVFLVKNMIVKHNVCDTIMENKRKYLLHGEKVVGWKLNHLNDSQVNIFYISSVPIHCTCW